MDRKKQDRFRFCKTKTCRKLFRVSSLSANYCATCVFARRESRAERHKRKRGELAKYPKGFAKSKRQMGLLEQQCAICLQTVNGALDLHHVIAARIAESFGDPHEVFNLVALCSKCHGGMKLADIRLYENDWLGWVAANRAAGLPDAFMKRALDGYGIGWGRLPL